MAMCIRSRLFVVLFLALFTLVGAEAAVLGKKVAYKRDAPVPFAAFTLTYLGERRVVPEKFPRGFLFYDFRVSSAQGTQTISWSAGTGDIAPLLFRVGGDGYALELQRSDKLGILQGNELVVSRAP